MKAIWLSTTYYLDPRVAALPHPDGERLFLRGLAYCGSAEQPGFIAESVLPFLGIKAHGRRAAELVASQLWVKAPGGYQIRRWDEWQERHDEIVDRRRKDRERKARERQRRRSEEESHAGQSRDDERDESRDVTALEEKRGGETAASSSAARDSPPQPPAIPDLQNALKTAGLNARWDKITRPDLNEVAELVATHTTPRLVTEALRQHRASDPAMYAQAWLPAWRLLLAPAEVATRAPHCGHPDCYEPTRHRTVERNGEPAAIRCPECHPQGSRRAAS